MKLAVIILSCDKYQAFWKISTARLTKHWVNFPGKKYLLTNYLAPEFDEVKVLAIGEDSDWSSNLILALKQVQEDYIILLFEDAILCTDVSETQFLGILDLVENGDISYVNLKGNPVPRGKRRLGSLREIPPGTHYRASLANSIWKKTILESLLLSGESAWAFEINASDRANSYEGFFGLSEPLFEIQHCLIRGRMPRRIYNQLKASDELPKQGFARLTYIEDLMHSISIMRNKLFVTITPPSVQQKVRRLFK